jgi:cardiolipin-specific phospholipase
MYGAHDWMDVAGGHAAKEKLLAEQRKALANATAEERARENGHAKVTMIRKAGHHVYLDGWEQFNQEMQDEMKDVEERQKSLPSRVSKGAQRASKVSSQRSRKSCRTC